MQMNRKMLWTTLAMAIVLLDAASAYIGPGAGLSAIGTVLAVLAALLLLVIGFVWYPIKKILHRVGGGKVSDKQKSSQTIIR